MLRRRFLALTTTGVLTGVGTTNVRAQSQPHKIRLGGRIGGWQGRAPDAIAGETNPTLTLDAGQTYELTWKNIDGQGHNFALLNSDGEVLKRTEIMSKPGETQTIEFTASTEMREYVCEPHQTSMKGTVSFGDSTGTVTTTPATEETKPYFPKGASIRVETVVDDERLVSPLGLEVANGENDYHYIVDRLGQVYVQGDDGLNSEPFIDISDRLAEISGEMGLLGMAFHPDYQNTRKFYLRYSAPRREGTPESYSHTEVLAEYDAHENGLSAITDSERTILEIPSPQDTHNSGAILFGPDDYLYIGMGDGGGGGDTATNHASDWYDRNDGGNGQDVTENLLGSILRINVDNQEGEKAYAIPDDNPLIGKSGLDEQFAWGFRNPWRMSFNDGELFAADVGEAAYEEVDIVRKGGNYGWNVREGTHCFDANNPRETLDTCPGSTSSGVRNGESVIAPIIEYPHTYQGRSVGASVIGGHIYGYDDIPALQGKYIFGDFWLNTEDTKAANEYGRLFAATPNRDGLWKLEELTIENRKNGRPNGRPTAFGRGNDGETYVLTQQPGAINNKKGGAVHRIRPPKHSHQTAAPTWTTATQTTNQKNDSNSTAQTTANPGENKSDSSGESGPGFGALVAISGLAGAAARLLTRQN